ncbi:MAG: aminoglycoside phosphotransferase family protein [Clostridium sp.]|uniref:phosphotransferase family protein n=1 Tax=Clostridium sp. TaxID=1506 RepID=UPI0025BAE71E|nr:phosphotransferase [Clostridium sp.]MCE5221327.1 aminoglycoside phosphotransferase family protein [Clostridium sp.]
MEYDWERTFPFLEIDKSRVSKLFEGILEEKNIINIIPINEGCRTTNYIIQTSEFPNKYILKIFISTDQSYKKEIKLLTKLNENKSIPVSKIYRFSRSDIIQNKEYAIYEYIEGMTLGQAIKGGYIVEERFVREVAKTLTMIHKHKFDKVGFLDEHLNVKESLPLLKIWYQKFMGERAKQRLGKNIINKINNIVKKNEKILEKLDEEISLVHGDFQGTNILIKNGKLSGILDWEFAMAGHPLSDIGQFFRYEEYFNINLLNVFEDEYNKNSYYKLNKDWYKISKLRDLINLIQLIDGEENMPNKYANIKHIIINNINILK